MPFNIKESIERARVRNSLPFYANPGKTRSSWFRRQAVMIKFLKLFLFFHFLFVQNKINFGTVLVLLIFLLYGLGFTRKALFGKKYHG